MFKLYKRDERGVITHYYEVWVEPHNRRIIDHFGPLGEQGEARPHRMKLFRSLERQVEELLGPAREAGFSEVGIEDHTSLVVSYAERGFGDLGDMDKRDALEERLNEILGWTGLGHCDGSSHVDDCLEVACFVLDVELASTAISEGLAGGEFANFTRIYSE
ncbi:MAG: hypothetical protein AAFO88_07570 [Pseudomonadota bacterium]